VGADVGTLYSVDTSTFLQSWRFAYKPKVFPALWRRFEAMIDEERMIASSEVLTELAKRDDEVSKWAKRQGKLFVPIDAEVQLAVSEILKAHRRLVDTRRGRSGADPFVIALAQVRGAVVVSEESASGSLEKPKIPDVCQALGIRCCRVYDLLEEEGFTFELDGR
jgi:hypothetical protein